MKLFTKRLTDAEKLEEAKAILKRKVSAIEKVAALRELLFEED